MQVITETPDQMVLEDRPWLLGSLLALGILVFLGLALGLFSTSAWLSLGFGLAAALIGVCFVVFVRRVRVIFDRNAGALVIRTRSLLGETEKTLALSGITGATVETSRSHSTDNDGRSSTSVTHRPVLATRTGPVPLAQVYSAGSGAEVIVAAITRWLAR